MSGDGKAIPGKARRPDPDRPKVHDGAVTVNNQTINRHTDSRLRGRMKPGEKRRRKMDEFEKVEKLRQRANVTYEEAKEALKQADGDLLDAMILLEGQGKVSGNGQTSRSTTYDEQSEYINVRDTVEKEDRKSDKTLGQKIKYLFHLIWIKCKSNEFVVDHKGERVVTIPLWVLVLAMIISLSTVGIVLLAGLFFDCRYAVIGPDESRIINDTLEKAGDVVDQVKDGFEKL